jgi:hypothetical protein
MPAPGGGVAGMIDPEGTGFVIFWSQRDRGADLGMHAVGPDGTMLPLTLPLHSSAGVVGPVEVTFRDGEAARESHGLVVSTAHEPGTDEHLVFGVRLLVCPI